MRWTPVRRGDRGRAHGTHAWYFLAVILLRSPLRRLGVAALVAIGFLLAFPRTPYAHDIPPSVRVMAFIKPEGKTLRVVLRAPLESMRDVNFPTRGPGYLDVAAADPILRDATKLWIADELHLHEYGVELPTPAIAATHISLPSDRSFESYDAALAHARSARLADSIEISWKQAMLDVVLEYPISSDQ